MNIITLFLNWSFDGHSFQYVSVYNVTITHARSHWSYILLTGRSRVNISELALGFSIMYHLQVPQGTLRSYHLPIVMFDWNCVHSSLQVVLISCKNEPVFIHYLSNITLQNILDALGAAMIVSSKCSIDCNNSRPVPWWRFYLHWGFEENSRPGIICIVCHPVVPYLSENGSSSMGRHLLANAHIAKSNKLWQSEVTEFTSTTLNETALTVKKRQESGRSAIGSWKWRFILNI